MTTEYAQMKAESEMVREQLKDEIKKKQTAEGSVRMLCEEKGM